MINIPILKHLCLATLSSWSLFPLHSAGVSCPDGNQCPDGQQCCSISPNKFGCCDVWKFLMQEMDVAGREHSLGLPSEFSKMHLFKRCHKSNCPGTCCDNFCCEHRNAECCGSPHQCCKVGYKCCGSGQWCCEWKTKCSSAYGYCISSVMSTKQISAKESFIILILVYTFIRWYHFWIS